MKIEKKMKKIGVAGIIIVLLCLTLLTIKVRAIDPVGPDAIELVSNDTQNTTAAKMVNISGGRIATLNVNATIQNPRWKAFIGNVTGKFTLMDSSGSAVFDWTIAAITGRIYATSNYSAISWSSINCSNITNLELENVRFNHTRSDDNITKTFNSTYNSTSNKTVSGSHNAFYVGNRYMPATTCPTLNTYENSAAQDVDFEEVSLYDGNNMVYATLLEDNEAGYNGAKYDFQMIVPEIGLADFSGATAYYI